MSTSLLQTTRVSRRRFGRFAAAGVAVPALLAMNAPVALQAPVTSSQPGDVPTTGSSRPGPMGLDPGPVALKRGVRPVALNIDKLQIAADVETINIVNGQMQNPTGPFIVSWYEETAGLGQIGNVAIAGHVDYWNVGAAVFYNLYYGDQLQEGDRIALTGEDGTVFNYEVDYQELLTVEDLTPESITDLIFPKGNNELLTLITCGGDFDYTTGEYLSRVIVRGHALKA